jgi:hypothetical protein
VRDSYDFEIDPVINGFVTDWITVFTSNDQERFLLSAEQYIITLDAKHLTLDDRWHFNSSYGSQNKIFIELVDEIVGENDPKRTDYWSAPTQDLQSYVLINFIPRHITPEIIAQFHEWIQDYSDHQIINFPAERWDLLPEEIVTQYADRIQTRQRTEHEISQSLAIFQQADAGFGQRLHFIIACVYYRIPIFRMSYSEKVDKILTYFDGGQL